jgi:hypothetical protein
MWFAETSLKATGLTFAFFNKNFLVAEPIPKLEFNRFIFLHIQACLLLN